jgi:hypothetical protein
MNTPSKLLLLAVISLGACTEMQTGTLAGGSDATVELPESVRAIAAPNQNLDTVVLLEEDNCYWYEHRGPVETTLLPLRTTRGNTICVEAAPAAAAPAS